MNIKKYTYCIEEKNLTAFKKNVYNSSLKLKLGVTSECVFIALGIQHAKYMLRILLSSLACPALQYFCTLSH